MSGEETRPEEEVKLLKLEKERMELKAQIAAIRAPWWRRASLIATSTAIIAAILPVTTAIQEHYRNEREYLLQQAKQQNDIALQQAKQQNDIALQQTRQENDIRMAYLARYAVPGHRLQTLRFLIRTSTDAKLVAWAQAEERIVTKELDKIEEERVAVLKKLDETPQGPAREDLKDRLDKLDQQKNNTMKRPPPMAGEAGAALWPVPVPWASWAQ